MVGENSVVVNNNLRTRRAGSDSQVGGCQYNGPCRSSQNDAAALDKEECPMDTAMLDRLAIREVVENWVVFRDSADWERFATVWHDDGWMTATWFQGPARRLHRGEPQRLRGRSEHPAPARRLVVRARRRAGRLAGQDGHPAAGGDGWDRVRRVLLGTLLRLLREEGRPLGHRPPPTDLREGPPRPGRSRGAPDARRRDCSPASPRAIATSPTYRRRPGSWSSRVCPVCGARRWSGSTLRARPGWPGPTRRVSHSDPSGSGPVRLLRPACNGDGRPPGLRVSAPNADSTYDRGVKCGKIFAGPTGRDRGYRKLSEVRATASGRSPLSLVWRRRRAGRPTSCAAGGDQVRTGRTLFMAGSSPDW